MQTPFELVEPKTEQKDNFINLYDVFLVYVIKFIFNNCQVVIRTEVQESFIGKILELASTTPNSQESSGKFHKN